jgi:hypothetical protein
MMIRTTLIDRISHWLGLPHDPRMRLKLKDMDRFMAPRRLENPHAPLPNIERELHK